MKRLIPFVVLGLLFTPVQALLAQQLFSQIVGPVNVKPVESGNTQNIPFITWGGDVATFMANGGLETKADSIYGKAGLKIKLTPGDDFVAQVKDYLGGKTPFLRGTMRMLGQASEVLGKDPRTKPVVIMQLSWSAGDHIVAREKLKTLNDLRGKDAKIKIACQQGGPHVGLLYDSLDAAKISRDEVEIVWVSDLTGPNGPADLFRKDNSVDACCVITPDMIGLTGGMDSVGSGAEGTVKGAHILNSTQTMSRSIADVYAVRADWYKNNREYVEKFVAGYLSATEKLVAQRRQFEEQKRLSPEYRKTLQMSQDIFGKEVLPTLEVDAHGLLLDCSFVGLQGQMAFFNDPGNLSNFDRKMSAALDLATGWGYAKTRSGFDPPTLEYRKVATLAKIDYVPLKRGGGTEINSGDWQDIDDVTDSNTIVSFTINFGPNQANFPADRYGADFTRALQSASTFGNAAIVIRGHADPTKALLDMVKGGIEKKTIKRVGNRGNFKYFYRGKELKLTETATIIKLIETGAFDTRNYKSRQTVNAALGLSLGRAQAVKQSLIDFAKQQNVNLVEEQLQPTGAGISEPLIPKPANFNEALQNMRVEFRIVKVPAEALDESDFQF